MRYGVVYKQPRPSSMESTATRRRSSIGSCITRMSLNHIDERRQSLNLNTQNMDDGISLDEKWRRYKSNPLGSSEQGWETTKTADETTHRDEDDPRPAPYIRRFSGVQGLDEGKASDSIARARIKAKLESKKERKNRKTFWRRKCRLHFWNT